MAKRSYVAKRVGDRYEVQPASAVKGLIQEPGNLATAAGGAALALFGLRRGGLLGVGLSMLGGGLVYRTMTGKSLYGEATEWFRRHPLFQDGPSYHHEERRSDQRPEDEVDEASMESFPASDSPAHTASTGAI